MKAGVTCPGTQLWTQVRNTKGWEVPRKGILAYVSGVPDTPPTLSQTWVQTN